MGNGNVYINHLDPKGLINDIAEEKELIALTVAEPMPRLAIRLKKMLSDLPLI